MLNLGCHNGRFPLFADAPADDKPTQARAVLRFPFTTAVVQMGALVVRNDAGLPTLPTLVNMAETRAAAILLPPPYMGDGQPLHEGRQLPISFRPHQKMPVIRHHRVRANPHR